MASNGLVACFGMSLQYKQMISFTIYALAKFPKFFLLIKKKFFNKNFFLKFSAEKIFFPTLLSTNLNSNNKSSENFPFLSCWFSGKAIFRLCNPSKTVYCSLILPWFASWDRVLDRVFLDSRSRSRSVKIPDFTRFSRSRSRSCPTLSAGLCISAETD